jgi:hypothetical protein
MSLGLCLLLVSRQAEEAIVRTAEAHKWTKAELDRALDDVRGTTTVLVSENPPAQNPLSEATRDSSTINLHRQIYILYCSAYRVIWAFLILTSGFGRAARTRLFKLH